MPATAWDLFCSAWFSVISHWLTANGYVPTGPSLTLTITAGNGNNVTVNGSDSANGNFTLQGKQIGNCFVVSGNIGALSSTFYGLVVAPVLSFDDPNQDFPLALLTKQ